MNTIISFGLCPFVQRSLITMNYKNVAYNVEYIDLENKPDWFLEISPLGKVPILKVGEEILFESAVINEYVDETSEGSLHPSHPLQKAKERAYIELASTIIMNYFQAATSKDIEGYKKHNEQLSKNLSSLLKQYEGPFFRGKDFSLVDTSFIPAMQRFLLTNNLLEDLNLSNDSSKKLSQWMESTLQMDAVIKSVPEKFENDYKNYLIKKESYIHTRNL